MNSLEDIGLARDVARNLITGCRTARTFLPMPVDLGTVRDIHDLARYAPSGSKSQPRTAYMVTGQTRRRIVDQFSAAFDASDGANRYAGECDDHPRQWQPPYGDRHRKIGRDLSALLDIGKPSKVRKHAQHRRNVGFFCAPISLFFTTDCVMGQGSWFDYDMFFQNVMTGDSVQATSRITVEIEDSERSVCVVNTVSLLPEVSGVFHPIVARCCAGACNSGYDRGRRRQGVIERQIAVTCRENRFPSIESGKR